jgi:hypothetical protein
MNTLAVDFKQLEVATKLVLTFPSVTTSTKMGYPNYLQGAASLTDRQTINLTVDYQRQISGLVGRLSEISAQTGLVAWLLCQPLLIQRKTHSRMRKID